MLVRILVAIAILPLLPLVLYVAPDWALACAVSAVSALSVWELLAGTGFLPSKRPAVYAAVFSACIPLWVFCAQASRWADAADWVPLAFITGFCVLLFAEAIAGGAKFQFTHISAVFFAALMIPFFFSSLVRVAALPNGRHYILLPFIAAILSDICAYFTGILWGRRKLTPISPKKTWEGAAGGMAGVLLGMAGYGLLQQTVFGNAFSLPLLLLYGLLGGAAGMLGDLSMSLVKREFSIKDFGSLLPGHGGALDRFDSLLFAAPVLEVLIRLLPAMETAL
ncbi:MAG: phosphatidate cytidylyltransferase [Oscillospiraceae bacterium]|nr:phosphatidate cytidylyltransferase [Oscillospiraceae bacterium]